MKKAAWIALAIGLAVAVGLVGRNYVKKRDIAGVPAQSNAIKTEAFLDIVSADIYTTQNRELAIGVGISGNVKAANSAMVKARVAGELQGLSVREGDRVRAGQVIARVESSEFSARVRQAQQQADAAKAQLDTAQRSFDNNQALVNQGFISQTALDTARNSLNAAQANHKAAMEAITLARKSQDDAVLRAPISGQIAQRAAQNGERVGIDARIVEIVDLSRLELEVAVPTADAAGVQVGQVALVRIDGFAEPVRATVARISPAAQAANRTVLTYLSLPALPGLRQGLFAQGSLGLTRTTGVAVPLSAVRTDKPQPYIPVVTNQKVAHLRADLGERAEVDGELYVIVRNLSAGQTVLRGSLGLVAEGVSVRSTAPTANASAAKS
jgi:RND family efflux transporter MFP subunit